MRLLSIFLLLAFGARAHAQVIDPDTLRCAVHDGPVKVTPLHSDSLSTSFLICVHTGVKPHLHRMHTEHVVVLEGEGVMVLDGETRAIKAGDVVVIPAGTVHSVNVTSAIPLRVISVQSPMFDGSDRIMIEEQR